MTQALLEMDCIPAGMEMFPAIDEDQFEFIKTVIDDCDYYLLIIAGRYGSLDPEGVSYTEKEHDYAVAKGIPVITLLHANPESIEVRKTEQTEESREKLAKFREKAQGGRLSKEWKTPDDLAGLVSRALHTSFKRFPATGWIRADKAASEDLLSEINVLRRENGELKEQSLETEANAIEDIAPLEDVMEIWGTRIYQTGEDFGGPSYAEEKWNESITWEQLFKLIAPYLTTPQSDSDVEKILVRSFIEGADVDKSFVDNQLFQTIKIQLEAHKLIDFNTNQHGKWILTPNGRKLMTHLRVIKRLKEAPHALTRSSGSTEPSGN